MNGRDELVEILAELEHEQWISWADVVMKEPPISKSRVRRWTAYMVPYDELPEWVKEKDRIWARKVLEAIEGYVGKEIV